MRNVVPIRQKQETTDTTEWLAISSLETDPRVNRPLSEARADRIAQELDPDYIGVLHVSERANGSRVIVDGQHRVAACRQLGWEDQKLECKVYRGLTLPQEAALFVHLNDFRRPTFFQSFLKRITAKDPDAVMIDEIVRGVGLKIDEQNIDGHISCVRTLERVFRGEKFNVRTRQPIILRKTLLIAKQAWGLTKEAMQGDILHGLGMVLLRYGKAIDEDHLHSKLAPVAGGPLGLLGKARTLRSIQGGTVAQNVAATIVSLYNKGKREHKLNEWQGAEKAE